MKLIIFLLAFATSVFASGECEFAKYVINSDKVLPEWIQVNCLEDDGTHVIIAFDRQLTHIFKRVRPSDAGLAETETSYSHHGKTGKKVFMDEVEYDDLGVKKRSLQKVLDISLRDVYDSIRNEFQFPVRKR